MSSAICTLFEGHYHYGVAALVNSLCKQGYKGEIYVGYRGILPYWAQSAIETTRFSWVGSYTLTINSDIVVHFLPLTTNYHLTNYKPDFMLELLAGPAKQANSMFYFDPDIVIVAPWRYFLEWIECGMAVSEDINSPITKFHPKRVAWRKYFIKSDIILKYKSSIYVNGGFVGVSSANYNFLNTWKLVQESMSIEIGGLDKSAFKSGEQLAENLQGDFAPFGKTDQDALNAAIEAWEGVVSFMGKEAMAFSNGPSVMPHALGSPKPWNLKILNRAFSGRSPRLVDRIYWDSVHSPIALHSQNVITLKKRQIDIAAFIGRFYKKS
jgi:hypothetical protein